MILLANSLVSPGVGTIFWSALIFILFLLILSKFAWKPILSAVNEQQKQERIC
jgi:F-type H+-transporting ATPase subunit b